MKVILTIFTLFLSINYAKSQSCEEVLNYVKSQPYGSTYTSFDSDAIAKVTFYKININYKTLYFAVVCFKQKYSFNCSEYIYQVASDTQLNYSMSYLNSAGKAFWEHIQPYSDVLGCAPKFK